MTRGAPYPLSLQFFEFPQFPLLGFFPFSQSPFLSFSPLLFPPQLLLFLILHLPDGFI